MTTWTGIYQLQDYLQVSSSPIFLTMFIYWSFLWRVSWGIIVVGRTVKDLLKVVPVTFKKFSLSCSYGLAVRVLDSWSSGFRFKITARIQNWLCLSFIWVSENLGDLNLVDKKNLYPCSDSIALIQLNPIHKRDHEDFLCMFTNNNKMYLHILNGSIVYCI